MVLKAKKTYIYPNWRRPNISADGVIGGDYFACSTNVTLIDPTYGPWRAFDGVYPTSSTDAMFHSANGSTVGYIEFYNPRPLCVTNIRIYNQPNFNSRSSSSGSIEVSNDGISWDVLDYYTYDRTSNPWNISLSSNTDYYKYYRINSDGTVSDSYWSIGELEITATVQQEAYNPITATLTQNKSNIIVNGTLTDSGNVISGFNSSNYGILPVSMNFGTAPWEYVVPFIYSTSSSWCWVMGGDTDRKRPCLGIDNNHFRSYLSSNGTTWNIAEGAVGSQTLTPNTLIYAKLQYTGSQYICSHSYDGYDYTNDFTINNSNPINQNSYPSLLGYSVGSTNYITSIDLSGAYLKVNGEDYWKGVHSIKTYKMHLSGSKPTPVKSIVTNEDIDSNTSYGSISDASAGSYAYLATDANGLNYGNMSIQDNPHFWYWTLPTGSVIENMDIELTNSNSSNTLLTVYQGTVSSGGKLGDGTGNSSSKTYNVTNLTPTNGVIIIKSNISANNPAQNVTMFVKNLVIKKP